MWCIAEITPQYRERMYRLLDLYQERYDPDRPVVCLDEKSKQLIGDARAPMVMSPGRGARHDYEYKRNGTRNIFVAVEPKGGRRTISVTRTWKKRDFAVFVKHLVEQEYGQASQVRIVLDNLNTHFKKSFTETFPKEEAEQLLERISFYYTPKHASWLNMAEIEINMTGRECLGNPIGSEERLLQQVGPWVSQRNEERKKINWTFTKQIADKKLSKYYAP